MTTQGFALIVAGGLVVASLWQVWIEIERASAPRVVRILAIVLAGCWYLTAVVWYLGVVTSAAVVVASAAWVSFVLFGARLVPMFGGPTDLRSLNHEYFAIVDEARRSGLRDAELSTLRRRIVRLSRYSSPLTREWIKLAQEELLDWAYGRTIAQEDSEKRAARIKELGDRLFLTNVTDRPPNA